jgi:hypothetical protein
MPTTAALCRQGLVIAGLLVRRPSWPSSRLFLSMGARGASAARHHLTGTAGYRSDSLSHRFNIVYLGSISRDVHSCTHLLRPCNPPPPPDPPDSYTRALLVSKDRRHLFVTPWSEYSLMSFNVCYAFCHWPMRFFQFFPHIFLENCREYFPQIGELYCLPAFWSFSENFLQWYLSAFFMIRLWLLFLKVLQKY